MDVLDHSAHGVSAGGSRTHQANYPNISYLNFIRFLISPVPQLSVARSAKAYSQTASLEVDGSRS
jgi:hypothetical protein